MSVAHVSLLCDEREAFLLACWRKTADQMQDEQRRSEVNFSLPHPPAPHPLPHMHIAHQEAIRKWVVLAFARRGTNKLTFLGQVCLTFNRKKEKATLFHVSFKMDIFCCYVMTNIA